MPQSYLLNLLTTNPQVQNFIGLGFSDFPNPTRAQVKAAWQSLVDSSKYSGNSPAVGTVQPVAFPDPSVQYLSTASATNKSLNVGANPTVVQNQLASTIGLNTGPNMDAYVENIYTASQVE